MTTVKGAPRLRFVIDPAAPEHPQAGLEAPARAPSSASFRVPLRSPATTRHADRSHRDGRRGRGAGSRHPRLRHPGTTSERSEGRRIRDPCLAVHARDPVHDEARAAARRRPPLRRRFATPPPPPLRGVEDRSPLPPPQPTDTVEEWGPDTPSSAALERPSGMTPRMRRRTAQSALRLSPAPCPMPNHFGAGDGVGSPARTPRKGGGSGRRRSLSGSQ